MRGRYRAPRYRQDGETGSRSTLPALASCAPILLNAQRMILATSVGDTRWSGGPARG